MVRRLRGARASSIGPSRVLEGAVPELPVDAATPAVHLAGLIDGDSVPPAAREKPHRDVPQAAHLHGLVGVRGGAAAQLPKLQGIMGTCQTARLGSSCKTLQRQSTLQCCKPLLYLQTCKIIPHDCK